VPDPDLLDFGITAVLADSCQSNSFEKYGERLIYAQNHRTAAGGSGMEGVRRAGSGTGVSGTRREGVGGEFSGRLRVDG
jgi:hypothetical protein